MQIMEENSTNFSNYGSSVLTLNDNETHELKHPLITMNDVAQWLEAFPQGSIIGWEDLVSEILAKLKPPQEICKLEAEVQPSTQEKEVMEIEGVNAVVNQNKQMHQQTLQQLELMVRKTNELRTVVVNAYNLPQNSHGWNQPEKGFGSINYEQQSHERLHSPNSTSNLFQHKSQGDVYNPPWRTHSNWRRIEHQNQGPKDFNYNNPNFTNQQKHHHTNNNHYTSP
ncbi:hypothetical protein AHAS_Ahas19G0168600 [Arachis hypogaea]